MLEKYKVHQTQATKGASSDNPKPSKPALGVPTPASASETDRKKISFQLSNDYFLPSKKRETRESKSLPNPDDPERWLAKVSISGKLTLVCRPVSNTYNIGFDGDQKPLVSFSYRQSAEKIFARIAQHKSDESISDADCIKGIKVLQYLILIRSNPQSLKILSNFFSHLLV